MISGGMIKKIINMKCFKTILLFIVLLSFFQKTAVSQNKEIAINADMQYDYAQKCFEEKDYTTAIFEFKRFIHFFDDHKYVLKAEFQIGQAFYNLKEYKNAVMAFNKIILADNADILILSEPDLSESFIVDAYFMKSKALMLLEKFNASEVCMQNLLMVTDDQNVKDRAYSFLALLYLKIAETNPDALKRAEKFVEEISQGNIEKPEKEKLKKLLDDMNNLETKNPTLAGIASVIPGAGYMYCERYKDGMISFLFNTALIVAAYKAFDDGNYALGGAISFIETGFYTGNIYGAVNSAHKYNRRKRNEFIRNVHGQFHLKIDNSEEDEAIFLFFEIPF